jgi:phosphoribosylformylglycinamidine cyclo-ligase
MTKPIRYSEVVNYEEIDPFKIHASKQAASTAENLPQHHGYTELTPSRGESCFVWDEGDRYRVGVMEGLGTKNLATDAVDAAHPDAPSRYGAAAQDSLAMIANDSIVSGGRPQLFCVHVAAGESGWFADAKKTQAFNMGCAAVCNEIGVTWAGGESPALPGIIMPGTAEISGFMIGEIYPKVRYVPGNTLQHGDAIVLIESSGIHANGLSAARKLADGLPDGYETVLPSGATYGETLLQPTHLYVNMVKHLLDRGIPLKRMENITGHGWRKLMRAREEFTYRMHELPPAMEIFNFLQQNLQVDDGEMFGNYNMGTGFAIYVPQTEVTEVIASAAEDGFMAWHAGTVEAGPKQVIIEPKKLILAGASLALRK